MNYVYLYLNIVYVRQIIKKKKKKPKETYCNCSFYAQAFGTLNTDLKLVEFF